MALDTVHSLLKDLRPIGDLKCRELPPGYAERQTHISNLRDRAVTAGITEPVVCQAWGVAAYYHNSLLLTPWDLETYGFTYEPDEKDDDEPPEWDSFYRAIRLAPPKRDESGRVIYPPQDRDDSTEPEPPMDRADTEIRFQPSVLDVHEVATVFKDLIGSLEDLPRADVSCEVNPQVQGIVDLDFGLRQTGLSSNVQQELECLTILDHPETSRQIIAKIQKYQNETDQSRDEAFRMLRLQAPEYDDESGKALDTTSKRRAWMRSRNTKAQKRLRKLFPPMEVRRSDALVPSRQQAHHLFKEGYANLLRDPKVRSCFYHSDRVPFLEDEETKLKDHQREGLGQILACIKKHRGAILADEMDLGKTIVAIALIAVKISEARNAGRHARCLIVMPKALRTNWIAEFAKWDSEGQIRIQSYDNENAHEVDRQMLLRAHVIITTYPTLQKEWRQLKDAEAQFHWARSGLGSTYEMAKAADNTDRRRAANAAHRSAHKQKNDHQDEPTRLRLDRPEALLFADKYDGLMFDEVQHARNRDSILARAMLDISSAWRLCITGTPMQNRYWDAYPLLRLLRLEPFCKESLFEQAFATRANRGGRHVKAVAKERDLRMEAVFGCVLRSVMVMRKRDDLFEGQPVTDTWPPHHQQHKTSLCPDVQKTQLATKDIWHKATREQKERDKRDAKKAPGFLDDGLEWSDTSRDDDRQIFALMHRAKLDAFHPRLHEAHYTEDISLITQGETLSDDELAAMATFKQAHDEEMNDTDAPQPRDGPEVNEGDDIEDDTGEAVENDSEAAETGAAQQSRDALMEKNFNVATEAQRVQHRQTRDEFAATMRQGRWSSDKTVPIVEVLKACIEEVDRKALDLRKQDKVYEAKDLEARSKIIVFGDSLAALDTLEVAIEEKLGIKPERYDGTMNMRDREKTVARYEEEGVDLTIPGVAPSPRRILLATSKATAEGINLVHTAHVVHISPEWNAFNTRQCNARAIRNGNKKAVTVHSFVMLNSIEMRVLDVMTAKQQLVTKATDRDSILSMREALDHANAHVYQFIEYMDQGSTKVHAMFYGDDGANGDPMDSDE